MNANLNKQGLKIQVLQLIDACCVFVGFFFVLFLWNEYGVVTAKMLSITSERDLAFVSLAQISTVLYLAVPFVPLSLEFFGFYRNYGRQNLAKAAWRCIQATVIVFVAFTILALILKLTPHRPTLIGGFLVSAVIIWFRELVMRRRYKNKVQQSVGQTRLLIAGRPSSTDRWWEQLDEDVRVNYSNVGHFDLDSTRLDGLREMLSRTAAERVVFLADGIAFEKVANAMEECEIQGVEVWLAADFVRARICQPTFDSLGGTPMLVLCSTPSLSWSLILKDVMDRFGAFVLLILTSPFWLLAVLGIKLQSPGPIFYRQERAGKYGHPFYIWKFRTMIVDADKKLDELKQKSVNEMTGPVFKLEDDPRIFSFGKFMRKFSIDELPQLINVLKGEMSLVGPRPMAVYELPDIEKSEHRRKLSVKPGITCIWQVEGRNTITDFDEWVQLDLQYIDNWSLWLDVKILFKTVPAVLFSKGAS